MEACSGDRWCGGVAPTHSGSDARFCFRKAKSRFRKQKLAFPGPSRGLPGASEELVQRSGGELCTEVQLELKEQLDEGMITEAEAAWTTIRCYDLFSDD